MADTGAVFPGSAETVSEAPYDDVTWSNPTRVTASDDSRSSLTHSAINEYSYVLKAYNFDFSAIPAGSTIDGVSCTVECCQDADGLELYVMQLLDTGRSRTGTNQCAVPVAFTNGPPDVNITKGGAADLWGCALTRAWVQDSDFGVGIVTHRTANSPWAFADSISLTVYYTEATGCGAQVITARPFTDPMIIRCS